MEAVNVAKELEKALKMKKKPVPDSMVDELKKALEMPLPGFAQPEELAQIARNVQGAGARA